MSTTFETGSYQARVTRWQLTKAKNEKKTPQLAISFTPLGRIDPDNPQGSLLECPDTERTVFRSITEKTAKRLLADLKDTFEYPYDTFSSLDPENPEGFDLHDREFVATLAYEAFDGQDREKWNFGSGGYTGEPLTTAEIRRLDTLYGAGKPKRPRKQAAESTPPSTDTKPVPEENVRI